MNSKNRTWIIVAAVVVLIGGAGAIALLLSGDDDNEGEAATTAPVSTDADGSVVAPPELEETRPVEVVGDPLPPFDAAIADPAIGTAAPVISGQSFDGSPITIGGATGKPTMLVFLAHWCPHCNAEIPELIELDNNGGIPAELDIIGISTGIQPGQENYPPSAWAIEKAWPWPIMADNEESLAFLSDGGSGFPYTVLLDADGNVLSRVSGSRPGSVIADWISELLA